MKWWDIKNTRPALRVLFGAVTLMLLMVCANVAGLLLARGSRRGAEFALRSAESTNAGVFVTGCANSFSGNFVFAKNVLTPNCIPSDHAETS